MKTMNCNIDKCETKVIARGWCSMHYKRWQIHGHPEVLLMPQHFHGMTKTSEYKIWTHILGRCNNPKDQRYHDYGGRGIKVLFNTFEEFFAEVGKRPSPELTIDRIDNNGNYEKGNLRWATMTEQNLNKRVYKSSQSGLRGVRQVGSGKWNVRVSIGAGKQKVIGTFDTLEEAKKALV